jgi:SPP1 family predicted phage head-tail adaptor
MRAGALRHQITIERFISGQDDYGQPIEAWEPVGTVAAAVEPLKGREFMAAQAGQSEVTTRIRLRYRAGITAADRITHEGTVYNVLSIINKDMRNIELELMCKSAG